MHNFFCDELGKVGDEVFLSHAELKHLFKTLRAGKGDLIGLLDGKGNFAAAEIHEGKKLFIKSVTSHKTPEVKIHLYIAIPKRNKMDQLLRQCTEAGVWAIHPMICDYSVSVPDKVSSRWQIILQEACKQSENYFLPEITAPHSFTACLDEIEQKQMPAYYGAVTPESMLNNAPSGSSIAWLVGPEGGFSEKEIEMISEANINPINLGPNIMRVETAAVCGIALLNFYYKGN